MNKFVYDPTLYKDSWDRYVGTLPDSNETKIEPLTTSELVHSIVTTNPNTFCKNDDTIFIKPTKGVNSVVKHEILSNSVRTMFKPVRMWVTQNGCYTTVEWDDGTKTTARAEDVFSADPYYGFCACVVKKLYGSTTKAMKLMQSADEKAKEPAKKRQEERELRKKAKQCKVERDRKTREAHIQMYMRDIREKREARRRVMEADERSENND